MLCFLYSTWHIKMLFTTHLSFQCLHKLVLLQYADEGHLDLHKSKPHSNAVVWSPSKWQMAQLRSPFFFLSRKSRATGTVHYTLNVYITLCSIPFWPEIHRIFPYLRILVYAHDWYYNSSPFWYVKSTELNVFCAHSPNAGNIIANQKKKRGALLYRSCGVCKKASNLWDF